MLSHEHTPVTNDQGALLSTLCSSKEITERKRLELFREMGREILQLLNESLPLKESLARMIELLKLRTSFDAIGIRLQEGEDFPYMAQQGFPPDFCRQENTLVGRTQDGGIRRDEQGRPILECSCGLVISGSPIQPAPSSVQAAVFGPTTPFRCKTFPQQETPVSGHAIFACSFSTPPWP
jgi:hypothetical protein